MSFIPEYGSGRSLEDIVLRYLEWVPEVKVEATVDGLVTLKGVVYSEAVRATAGEVAKAIPGVRSVTNDIELQPLFAAIPGDVARAAERSRDHEIKTVDRHYSGRP
jgi:BON domain